MHMEGKVSHCPVLQAQLFQLNSDQNACDIPLYWFVKEDPYNGLL